MTLCHISKIYYCFARSCLSTLSLRPLLVDKLTIYCCVPCEPETEKLADRTQSYKYKYYLRAGEFYRNEWTSGNWDDVGERWGTIRRVIATFRSSIFMTFDIFIVSRNISMITTVNDFFCFLLKSELVWYLESSHLYHCRGWCPVSSLPAGVSVSALWSDSASISVTSYDPEELQEILSQTWLQYRRHSTASVYNWFWKGKGDIKIQSLFLKSIIFSRQVKFHLHPSVILSVRLHADNCCLVTLLNINTQRLEHPEHNVNIFLKG